LSPPLRLGSRRVILGATSLADTNQAALSISGEVRGVSMRKSAQAKIEKSETGKSSDWATVFSISIKVLADIVRVRLGAEHSKDVRFPARPDARWRSLVFQAQRIGRSVCPLHVDFVEEPLFWRQHLGFVAMSARQIPGSPPHVAKMGAGSGMSFASFRRFWAVAANRNSSLAPFGPRRRNRPSLRMRFR
jgi:hypothetical protein